MIKHKYREIVVLQLFLRLDSLSVVILIRVHKVLYRRRKAESGLQSTHSLTQSRRWPVDEEKGDNCVGQGGGHGGVSTIQTVNALLAIRVPKRGVLLVCVLCGVGGIGV